MAPSFFFAKHPCQPLEWNVAYIPPGETELDQTSFNVMSSRREEDISKEKNIPW